MCGQRDRGQNDFRLKDCSAGEAVTAETRPVEQTIYSPTEFPSPRIAVPSLSFQQMAGTQPFAMARAQPSAVSGGVAHRDRGTAVICASLIPHRRRRTRRQWARVDLDHAMRNAHAVGDELLGERRRRAAVLQPVLVAVPRAGDTAVDDAPFADRPILVGAKIGERPDLRAVAEHRDAFAIRRRDDAGTLVWD